MKKILYLGVVAVMMASISSCGSYEDCRSSIEKPAVHQQTPAQPALTTTEKA